MQYQHFPKQNNNSLHSRSSLPTILKLSQASSPLSNPIPKWCLVHCTSSSLLAVLHGRTTLSPTEAVRSRGQDWYLWRSAGCRHGPGVLEWNEGFMLLFCLKICFLSLRQIFRPRSSRRRHRHNHRHWQHGPGSSSPSPPADPRRRPFAALHPARTMTGNRLNCYPPGAQATNTTAATLNGRRRECDASIIAQKRGRGGRHASLSRELVSKIFFPGKSA